MNKKNKIKKAFQSGKYYQYKQLKNKFNISLPTLKKFTSNLKSLNYYFLEKTGIKVCKDYIEGETTSIRELSKKYNIPSSRVYSILNYYNIQIKDRKTTNRKCKVNLDSFKVNNINKKSAYWIGFLLGDGSVDHRQIKLKLQIKDLNHIKKFRDFLGSTHSINIKETFAGIYISVSTIVKDLSNFGIIPNKTYEESYNLHKSLKPFSNHFIRGYFDADGSICHTDKSGPDFYLCSNNKSTLETCNDIFYKYLSIKLKISNYQIYYIRTCSRTKLLKIYKYLYKDSTEEIRLNRKYKKVKHAGLLD